MKKLPIAIKHKDTGATEYINSRGSYVSKGCNGSAYGYKEHYELGYRPIKITFGDYVKGITFNSTSPQQLLKEDNLCDLHSLLSGYLTGTNFFEDNGLNNEHA